MSLRKIFTKFLAGKNEKAPETNDTANVSFDDQTKIFTPARDNIEIKQPLPATMKVISGVDAGHEVKLSGGRLNIGRAANNELSITDPGASRLHAFVVGEDGRHVIYDGRSMNGTYVNGMRITKKILQHGDAVKIANSVIIYELE